MFRAQGRPAPRDDRPGRRAGPPDRGHGGDGRGPARGRHRRRGRRASSSPRRAPGTRRRRCWRPPSGRSGPASRSPWRRAVPAVGPTAGYAFPGGGATWIRAGALPVGHLCALKARVALALGLGAGLDRDGLVRLLADPVARSPGADPMPLDALITGRIATLAGDAGFGWVEAIGVRDGRVAFAGTEVDLETRADPLTERISLEPDEVAPAGPDRRAPPPRPVRRRDPPGRPVRRRDARRGARPDRRRPRAPRRRGRLAGGPRLGLRPLGPLADRRRPGARSRPAGAVRSGRTTTTRCWPAGRRSSRPASTATRPTRRAA